MKFDPFNNRLCRDIRNRLSKSFMDALRTKSLQPASTIAAHYIEKGVEPYCQVYINNRLERYAAVLRLVKSQSFDDVHKVALCLWDEELFFEVHEYVEYHWRKSSGDDKNVLQAIIRAAGTYVHLEQGNLKGAKKMASKAIKSLEGGQRLLPPYFNVELLVLKLRNLDPVPPKLS